MANEEQGGLGPLEASSAKRSTVDTPSTQTPVASLARRSQFVAVEVGVTDAGPDGVPVYELQTADGYRRVAEYLSEADAKRIERCVNTHAELVAALQQMIKHHDAVAVIQARAALSRAIGGDE